MTGIEGGIRLDLVLADGHVAEARIASTRPVGASAALEGRPVTEALRLLPNIFSICGTAQLHAGLAAAEAALGIRLPEPQQVARRLLLLAETAEQHAWRLFMDWPVLAGGEPQVAGLAAARKPLSRLPGILYPDGSWNRLGGGRLQPDRHAAAEAVGEFFRALTLAEDRFTLPALVESQGLAGFGATHLEPLPELDLEAVLAADRESRFVAAPDWQGRGFHTGPLARRWEAMAGVRERFGAGLMAHLMARLDELDALVPEMAMLVGSLEHDGGVEAPRGDGIGLGVVEAARGRLFHRIEVEDGQVARYQILAPTEWNFHPRGPLVEGLRGAPARDIERHARLLVAALDPCVACEVAVHA